MHTLKNCLNTQTSLAQARSGSEINKTQFILVKYYAINCSQCHAKSQSSPINIKQYDDDDDEYVDEDAYYNGVGDGYGDGDGDDHGS